MSTDNSSTIKETICRELKLPIKFTPYFSLFIAKQILIIDESSTSKGPNNRNHSSFLLVENDKFINGHKKKPNCKYVLIRKMMDYEAPCLSLNCANQTSTTNTYYLKLIKFYWDNNLDDKLIENEIALNLIYIQAQIDFERHSNEMNRDHYRYLETLALRQSKKEVNLIKFNLKVLN